jgi:hypothetical protein
MALDSSGNVIVAGLASDGFPVTSGALQRTFPAPAATRGLAGFITKFDSTAQRLLFSTYFGGATPGSPFGLTSLILDSQGTIWVTGASPPDQLPAPTGTPLLGTNYLAALTPDGSTLANIFTAPDGAAGQAIALTNAARVAPYDLISLYGIALGPPTPVGARILNHTVATSLGGVQVLFGGIPAPLLYAGPTQINAIVPAEVFGSDTTALQIVTPSGTISGPTLSIRPSQPGVFPGAVDTSPLVVPAAALNQDGSVNSATNPAALGTIVTVWATGGGR